MCWIWIYLWSFGGVLFVPGVYHASAMEVFTPLELTAVNGTNIRLKCTFQSTSTVSETTVSVSWTFKPLNQATQESVFYYQSEPFPPESGRFKNHVIWAGNVLKNDGSIMLNDVQFTFNGTFICQVRNPPDVHSNSGEIKFEVVQTVKFSEIGILAAAVGGAIVLVLLFLAIFLLYRYCRSQHGQAAIEMEEPKNASVW